MNELDIFRSALGLDSPWVVESLAFSVEEGRLDITLDFARGSQFLCPICGTPCAIHDTDRRTWRHLNFFQYKTYLHARQPRIECPHHKVKTIEIPWARPGSGFTLLFEALVMVLAKNGMTPNAIGRMVGEYDTLIWRILDHYVKKARSQMDLSDVSQVGLDETSRSKGHRYITVFMDLDQRRIVYVTEGKGANTLTAFKADLEEHGGQAEKVNEFSLDMSRAFQSGIEKEFPHAQITFDQFHLMKLLNEAVDEVRKQEQKEHPELKGSKYLWLKNEWNQSARQKELFQSIRTLELKTNKAHHLKGVFQDVFSCSPEDGESLLRRWYYWATHSRLQPIIEFAKTVKRHWEGVVHWFQTKISNGLLEGMNSLIQAAKARSRGFRNSQYFITMIYLIGAKLDFKLPPVLPSSHSK